MMKHLQGKFRALGNIGDALTKMGNYDEAVKVSTINEVILSIQNGRENGLTNAVEQEIYFSSNFCSF